jgi:hypothetical protein
MTKRVSPRGEPRTLAESNLDESPIAWLRRRKNGSGEPMISEAQFNAGERLRADFHFAMMTPRVTMNWSAAEPASRSRRSGAKLRTDILDGPSAAAERVRSALAVVGPELSGVLIDVCCHLKGLEVAERAAGWPQRSAKIVLQLALTRLARHYGYEAVPQTMTGPARVRHWGAADYRPRIEGGPDDAR